LSHRRRRSPPTDELGQLEQPGHVDIENALPMIERLVLGGERPADRCVVDQHVDSAEALEGTFDEVFAVSQVGHVAGDGQRSLIAELFGRRRESTRPPPRDNNGGAGGGEHAGEALAEATRGAGDDGDAPSETKRRRERVSVVHGETSYRHRATSAG
jgi:hypothetical protein